jgi:RNA polymerase sigma-70 factor (ECF subfamily)
MEDPPMDRATPAAFENLIAHRAWVRRLARSLVLDEARADDLEQEVWLEALVRPPQDGRSPRGWLATALRHNAIDEARVEKRRTRREVAAARPEAVPSAADLVAEADALQRVVRAVLDLPEPYRTTLLRRFFDDLGPAAIAASEGVPVETVRTRLRRGLVLVREKFDRENEGDRRAWCLLLLPLARGAEPLEIAGPAAAGASVGLLALLTSKAAIAAGVLAVAGLGLWTWSGSNVPVDPVVPGGGLAGAVVANAAAPSPAAPLAQAVPPPAPPRGTRVEVLARDSGDRPVPGATVALLVDRTPVDPSFSSSEAKLPSSAPPTPHETRTCDGAGRAVFEDLPPGEWAVVASTRSAASRPVRLRAVEGVATGAVRLLLLPAHPVEGRVLRKDGKPIAGSLVSLLAMGARGGMDAEAATKTDATGKFRMEGVRPGRYYAMATLSGGAMHMVPMEVVVPGAESVEMILDDTSSARGRVVDDATNAPVSGAMVVIMAVSPAPPPAYGMASVMTAADGTFSIEGMPAGQVQRFLVRKEGFLPFQESKDGPAIVGTSLAPDKPLDVTVRLRKGATLKGRVTASSGNPVPKAEVYFAWAEVIGNSFNSYRTPSTTTDEDGKYSLPSAGPGTGIMVVRAEGYHLPDLPPDLSRALSGSGIPEGLRVTVPGTGEVVKDLVLTSCGWVEGRVVDADGKPVAGAAVSLDVPVPPAIGRWMEPIAAAPVWTDAEGKFRLDGLAPGEVVIRATHHSRGLFGRTGPTKVSEGVATVVRVEATTGAVVTGTVLREDETAAPGAVLRVAIGGVEKGMESLREKALAALEADTEAHPVGEGGVFRVAGLAPGTYTLFAVAEGCTPVRGVEVVLAAGEVRDELRFVFRGERLLTGRVVDENGSPIEGARITIRDMEEARVFHGGGVGAGATDADGRFRVPGLTAPQYRIWAQAPGCPEGVGEGSPGGPEVVLRLQRGLAIAGTVTDAESGKPLPGIQIRAQFLRAGSINDLEGGSAVTGADGSFRMESLRVGPYRIVVGDTQGVSPYVPEVLASVKAGTADVRAALRKGESIAGTVQDETGKPMTSHVVVIATRFGPDGKPDYSPAQRSIAIGPDGTFRLVGLAPGRYSLMFSPVMGPGSPGYIVRRAPDVETGTANLVFRMTKGVVVKGKTVNEDGTPAEALSGTLTVRPTGAAERDLSDQQSAWIKPDGTFKSEPLDPDRIWDFIPPNFPGLVGVGANAVKPGEGEVVITLRKGGSLRGRVLDEEGNPVSGLHVGAQAVGAERAPGGWAQSARTGDDGAFVLEGLGDFRFRIKTVGGEYQASTSEKEFVPGEEVEVRVKRGFVLSGRLVDGAGKGVKRDTLFATPEGGTDGMGVGVGDDGSFRFRGLAKGRFLLWLRVGVEKVELGTFEAPAEGIEVTVSEEE